MNWLEAIALGEKLRKGWKVVGALLAGEAGVIPEIRTKVGKGYWSIGPIPVRRIE